MRYSLSAGFIRDYVEAIGMRAHLRIEALPSIEELGKLREAVKNAYDQVDLLLDTHYQQLVTDGDSIYVDVAGDGKITARGGWGGVYLTLDSIYTGVEEALALIAAELPPWARVVDDRNSQVLRIEAKPDQSQLRHMVIPQITSNNRNISIYAVGGQSEYRYNTTSNLDRYGDPIGDFLKPATVSKLVALAKQIKTEQISVMRQLFSEGKRTGTVAPVPTHDTTASFVTFMRKRSVMIRDANDGKQHIPTLPTLPHGTKVGLTWGIEVEAAGARGVTAPSGWGRKYDSSLHSAYSDNGSHGGGQYIDIDPSDCYYSSQHEEEEQIENEDWFEDREIDNPDYDAEAAAADPDYNQPEHITEECDEYEYIDNPDWLDPDDCDGCGDEIYNEDYDEDGDDNSDCAEFVSPILRSYHSRGLESLVAELIEQPQNDSAGVHVHVGADHLTPRQIGTLLIGYQFIEGLIVESYNRETREYCKQRTEQELMRINKSAKTATKLRLADRYDSHSYARQGLLEYGDRYVALNICSLSQHGTVEFRAMGPVYSYDHLIRWAMFCREMVASVGNGAKTKDFMAVNTWEDLTALFAKFGNEYAAASIVKLENHVVTEQEALAEV